MYYVRHLMCVLEVWDLKRCLCMPAVRSYCATRLFKNVLSNNIAECVILYSEYGITE